MSVNLKKKEGNVVTLTFEITQDKVKDGLNKAFLKVRQKVNVPGFRKGKVPRQIFNQRFGEKSLYQETLDILLPEIYAEAVEETGIEPVDAPQINVDSMEPGESWKISAEVTVKPEVKLGDYKGLEVEKRETKLTDQEVEEEIKNLQERQADLVVKEEAAEIGDTVVLDFKGFKDGKLFEGGEAENYSLELGSGQFIPGFEDQLVGIKAGEEKEIEVTFPEKYHAEELAGQPVTFKTKVHEVKAKEVPELDDELAKDIDSEVETVGELKEKVTTRLKEGKESAAKQAKQDEVIQKAVENAEIDIPQVMIDREKEHLMSHFKKDLESQGIDPQLYYQMTGQTEEKMSEQMEKDAEKRVKTTLVLEKIAKEESIESTEEEVEQEIEELAKKYRMKKDAVRAALGDLNEIETDLKTRKAIDLLVDSAVEK